MVDFPVERDERRHTVPEGVVGWSERYDFTFTAGVGGHVSVWLWPELGRAWYWLGLVGTTHPLVAIVEADIALPRRGLELRANGLWADHNVETAMGHWSLGLEAFAIGVDEPFEVVGAGRGDRLPVGLDLEWESEPADLTVFRNDECCGYEQRRCAVHGEVLVGHQRYEVDGSGARGHHWGRLGATGEVSDGEDGELVALSPARFVAPNGQPVDAAWELLAGPPQRWRLRPARPV